MRSTFTVWLKSEVEEVAHYNAWFVFNLSFLGSDLLEVHQEPPIPHVYKFSSKFYGEVCVPDEYLIPGMQGSPFFK
jgi:hypothetical protein